MAAWYGVIWKAPRLLDLEEPVFLWRLRNFRIRRITMMSLRSAAKCVENECSHDCFNPERRMLE